MPFDRELSVARGARARRHDRVLAARREPPRRRDPPRHRAPAPGARRRAAPGTRAEDSRRRCSTTSTTSACSRSSCSTWTASCSPTRSRRVCTTPGTGRSRAPTPASSRTTSARCSGWPLGSTAPAACQRDGQLHRRDARPRRRARGARRAPARLRQGAAPRPQARPRHRHRRRRRRRSTPASPRSTSLRRRPTADASVPAAAIAPVVAQLGDLVGGEAPVGERRVGVLRRAAAPDAWISAARAREARRRRGLLHAVVLDDRARARRCAGARAPRVIVSTGAKHTSVPSRSRVPLVARLRLEQLR